MHHDAGGTPKPTLGVLFVHGIGEQPEGDTLLAFGDPLLDWLRRWFDRDLPGAPVGRIEVRDAHLQRDRAGVASPPHALLDLDVTADGVRTTQRWVLAEHWWAATVRPPPFGRLAWWLVTVGLWVIVSHATQGAAREGPRWIVRSRYVVRFVGGLLAAIGLQLLVAVLWVLSLLPLPWLGDALARWLLRLTSVLGDSYVLSESALNRATIVSSTRAAIAWLAERCERVVVLAHSQGGAIAHFALRQDAPANVRTLVTFGSGLTKLEELLNDAAYAAARRRLWMAGPSLVATLLALVFVAGEEAPSRGVALYLLGFLVLALVLWIHRAVAPSPGRADDPKGGAVESSPLPRGLRWVDIFASHDPVPNGPYPRAARFGDQLTSWSIVNRRSALADHTAYWENPIDFISRVGVVLGEDAGLRIVTPADEPGLADARAQRARRARWHLGVTLAGVVALALTLILHRDQLTVAGTLTLAWMHDQPWPFTALRAIFAWLRDITGARFSASGPLLLGLLGPLVLLAAWRAGMSRAWRAWDGWLDTCARHRVTGRSSDDRLYHVLFVAGALAPPVLVIVLAISSGLSLGTALVWVFIALMIAFSAVGLRREELPLGQRLLGAAILLSFAALLATQTFGSDLLLNLFTIGVVASGVAGHLSRTHRALRRRSVRAGLPRTTGTRLAALPLALPAAAAIGVFSWAVISTRAPLPEASLIAGVSAFWTYSLVVFALRLWLRRRWHRLRASNRAP